MKREILTTPIRDNKYITGLKAFDFSSKEGKNVTNERETRLSDSKRTKIFKYRSKQRCLYSYGIYIQMARF